MRLSPGRAALRYLSDDETEVSLPGYVNAVPGYVSGGGVVIVDEEHAEDMISSGRFEAFDLSDVGPDDATEGDLFRLQQVGGVYAPADEPEPEPVVDEPDELDDPLTLPGGLAGDDDPEENDR